MPTAPRSSGGAASPTSPSHFSRTLPPERDADGADGDAGCARDERLDHPGEIAGLAGVVEAGQAIQLAAARTEVERDAVPAGGPTAPEQPRDVVRARRPLEAVEHEEPRRCWREFRRRRASRGRRSRRRAWTAAPGGAADGRFGREGPRSSGRGRCGPTRARGRRSGSRAPGLGLGGAGGVGGRAGDVGHGAAVPDSAAVNIRCIRSRRGRRSRSGAPTPAGRADGRSSRSSWIAARGRASGPWTIRRIFVGSAWICP